MSNQYPFQQLAAKPSSRSIAIKAMCAQCAGGPTSEVSILQKQYDSDWKATIRDCPSTGCPLHVFRPYQARKAS
ncbi:hypothetical protein [uncultured Paraglaciecola sp.]|uniref:hypothetical protein n=1 Tax=uncultured Paraglaciecola sp. TaxID=1765024 RepID=UPI002623F2A2|nr:hypothetical protein [uncultured Paraglaciecola sp.]